MSSIRSVPLILTVALAGCNLVRVNGKPLFGEQLETPAETGGTAAAGSTANGGGGPSAPAAPPVTSTQAVAVKVDFRPNPIVVDNLGGAAEADLFTKYKIREGCEGYVTDQPGAVLELDHPMANVTITAPGAAVLYARFGDRYLCASPNAVGETPTLTMATWPAGKVELYAGHYNQHTKIRYAIEIEDTSRSRDLGWAMEGGAIALKALPAKPIIQAVAIPAAGRTPRGVMGCMSYNFRKDPDLAMTLARPLAGLELDVRAAADVQLLLMGPIPEDGRDIPSLCFAEGHAKLGRLDAGRYAIKLGTKGEAAATTVVVRGPDTPRDPAALAPSIPAELPIGDRGMLIHFPQLVEDDVWDQDALRQKLVAAAPRALFVFPKFDLDDTTARLEPRVGVSTQDAWPEDSKWEWPRKDEPLLVLGRGFFLSTDGNIFALDWKDLAPAPGGPIAVPAKARNPGLGWGSSVNAAGKEDKARLDAYWKATNRYRDCAERVWGPYDTKIAALQREAYSDARADRIAGLQVAARKKELSSCGASKLDAQQMRVWKELMASRTSRRTAALAGIKKRLAGLFAR